MRSKVLKVVHGEIGHQGQQWTLYLAKQRFYWLGLSNDMAEYVRNCRLCVLSKSPEPGVQNQKSHTTPYHLMGHGSCEKMNRTLGNMFMIFAYDYIVHAHVRKSVKASHWYHIQLCPWQQRGCRLWSADPVTVEGPFRDHGHSSSCGIMHFLS